MAKVLGVNAVFHDPAAAVVVDGRIVAAAEEERFSRRKHGKQAVPFSTWEVPQHSSLWCLEEAGLGADELDAVVYSYEPRLLPEGETDWTADGWEGLRTEYARRAPGFLASALPGLDPAVVTHVPHHVAHAASGCLAAPFPNSAVLVLDGRGETCSHLAGRCHQGELEILAAQRLPHSLGLMYEELTEHLGFHRSSDEYKVMALAAYGTPVHLGILRELIRTDGEGGFRVEPILWDTLAKKRPAGERFAPEHADLACSVQRRLEEVILDLASWLFVVTGEPCLTMAGGVALNCVANSRLQAEGPFDKVWVQPAAGDSGTALGAALEFSRRLGDSPREMTTAALGRGFSDEEVGRFLHEAAVPHERPDDLAGYVAAALARDEIVAWFAGRSEYGPRALGHRSFLANPTNPANTERMNAIKGREEFRPVAPMVPLEEASNIFSGPLPSPYMLFTHHVRERWRDRIPAACHVDGTARAQTVEARDEPVVHRLLTEFGRRTGVPVLINTSFNTAGRPMVDTPQDAIECFASSPVDLLVLDSYVVRRSGLFSSAAG